ncbi:hypothetical protein CWS02_05605 [Enterobacter sp. EA-1]|nr:hypothetical protein CWS02_05605 [Enterobacter sp. EA-1]
MLTRRHVNGDGFSVINAILCVFMMGKRGNGDFYSIKVRLLRTSRLSCREGVSSRLPCTHLHVLLTGLAILIRYNLNLLSIKNFLINSIFDAYISIFIIFEFLF